MAVGTSVTIGGERPCDDDFERRVIRGSNSNIFNICRSDLRSLPVRRVISGYSRASGLRYCWPDLRVFSASSRHTHPTGNQASLA